MNAKGRIAAGAAALLVAAGLFVGGRLTAPTKVEYKDKIVFVEKEVEKKEEKKDTHTTQVVKRTTVTRKRPTPPVVTEPTPPGCPTCSECPPIEETTTTEVIVTNTDDHGTVKTDKTRETAKAEEHSGETAGYRPQWRASALVAYKWSNESFVYGGEVERRILGPLWLGAWTVPGEGVYGLKASFEW
jgi:hypothetical protein